MRKADKFSVKNGKFGIRRHTKRVGERVKKIPECKVWIIYDPRIPCLKKTRPFVPNSACTGTIPSQILSQEHSVKKNAFTYGILSTLS